jgi:hypothetical protein
MRKGYIEQWLSIMPPSMFNSIKLCAEEFWDVLLLRYYDRTPRDLPLHCDECSIKLNI